MPLEIIGSGSYLPSRILPNSHFAKKPLQKRGLEGEIIEETTFTEDDIYRRTGILERRTSRGESPADMGSKAAVRALENSGVPVDSLVGIIMATVTQRENYPSAAIRIARDLDARNVRVAYDIAAACAGFPEALMQANARALSLPGNYLVVAAENLTEEFVNEKDAHSFLFGDGAGAAVLSEATGRIGIVAEYSHIDSFEGRDKLIFRSEAGEFRMPDGGAVLKLATKSMGRSVEELRRKAYWEVADVYIVHQANGRITAKIKEGLPGESKVYETIHKYGNTSASSCAIALDEALRDGTIQRTTSQKTGSRVILTSFGSGPVTSGVAIQF